eukprot:TRINITY_DN9707_c0_g1_i1.p1 TRINITY_DN9707_c0_g1~~TRINITY_DN9707_c0_g1_i1.p1  ORF type:complete len:208 (+),score=30.69 TRINITY_DN9707_c0_g1_i1:183-806(+)
MSGRWLVIACLMAIFAVAVYAELDASGSSDSHSGAAGSGSGGAGSGSGGAGSGSGGAGSGSGSGFADCSTTECTSCTSNHGCVFCRDNNYTIGEPYCVPGGWSGPSNNNNPCSGWAWAQCSITGHWAIIAIGCGAGAVFLLLLALTLCLWCRYRRRGGVFKSKHEAREDVEYMEEQRVSLLGGSRTQMTDRHRQQMREKHGIGAGDE